ncbi:hypothetical protein [Desulfonatronovibrio hydrogenovorans]|uniref:hypothetical protein n=1 Tax=Desulfonatronovibrio hydrogenovorans TaxID=53245 RepID=UPI00048E85B2|nr:hypothetical protein [Desulfonatronovibrio hydrogenovorans]
MLSRDMANNTFEYWYDRRNDQALVPGSHYFHTWMALAAFELDRMEAGNMLLSGYLNLEKTGHPEFNKHALLLICERHSSAIRADLAERVQSLALSLAFSVDFKTRTGNNWLVLRMFLHLKLYALYSRMQDLEQFRHYFFQMFDLEQGGMFCDFPPPWAEAVKENKAFPLTYSFKIQALFMECLGLLRSLDIEPELQSRLEMFLPKNLVTHLSLIAPDGEALYYGRSDNTLFGYANVLSVLSMLERHQAVESLKTRVWKYIEGKFSRNDTLIRCVPHNGFRDPYVYDSVYTAYFLARTLLSDTLNPVMDYTQEAEKTVVTLPVGVIVKREKFFSFISSAGCSIPDKGSDFRGYRYTGLTPMKIWHDEGTEEDLLSINRARINPANPELPLLPVYNGPGFKLIPHVFSISEITVHNNGCLISGEAFPVLVLGSRFLRRICNRIPFIRKVLQGVTIKTGLFKIVRRVAVDAVKKRVTIKDRLGAGTYCYYLSGRWRVDGSSVETIGGQDGVIIVRAKKYIELTCDLKKKHA